MKTTDNINKNYYFSIEDRLHYKQLFKDLRLSKNKIKVISFDDSQSIYVKNIKPIL